MKTLLVTGPRQAEFQEMPRPTPGSDDVLVQAKLTAVSTGTELRVFRAIPVDAAGQFLHETIPFQLPTENGYSMVGRIVDVGASVDPTLVGRRVFVAGSHKEFHLAEMASTVLLPDTVSDEHAVFLNIFEVAHRAIRQAELVGGENVAIVGQGVIGLSLLAYCVALGCPTVVVDPVEQRLQIARQIGAKHTVVPSANAEHADGHFDGLAADIVFEATSNWQGVRTAMTVANRDGTVIIVSRHTELPDFNPLGHPFLGKRLKLLTSYGYPPDGHAWDRQRSIATTLGMLSGGELNIAPMITHRIDWSRLPDMYRQIDSGDASVVGVVVSWPGAS